MQSQKTVVTSACLRTYFRVWKKRNEGNMISLRFLLSTFVHIRCRVQPSVRKERLEDGEDDGDDGYVRTYVIPSLFCCCFRRRKIFCALKSQDLAPPESCLVKGAGRTSSTFIAPPTERKCGRPLPPHGVEQGDKVERERACL